MFKFSLIIATKGRTKQLNHLLNSFIEQTYKNFELIIVDSNEDDRLKHIILSFSDVLRIKHIKLSGGLSYARNAGLKLATGNIIAFPDDDCWYPKSLLETVTQEFDSSIDGITCPARDSAGMLSSNRWRKKPTILNKNNLWTTAISFTIFLKKDVIEKVGDFDNKLGAGAWGSGEESDYLIRAVTTGSIIRYIPSFFVYHENPITNLTYKHSERAYTYGLGFGYLLKKYHYPFWFILYQLIKPLTGIGLSLIKFNPMKAKYYLGSLRGRIHGLLVDLW